MQGGSAPKHVKFPAARTHFGCVSVQNAPYRDVGAVRVEKWGKSPLAAWRHVGAVNSIRSNAVEEHIGLPDRSEEAA